MYQKPLQVLFIIFAALVLKELIYINTFHGQVSPIADGYSEANTIRGATFFHEKGLTHFNGLPDTCYTDLFPNKGIKTRYPTDCSGKAYTHYPPGPEYMGWLGFHLVGLGNFTLLRLLPIFLSILVGIFYIKTSFSLVSGGTRGLIFVSMLILPPMYSNYMHGLHHQQYAFIMLQTQMCLSILYFTQKAWRNVGVILAFVLLGFFQGWMTFDFAFLATLFVVPFYIYFKESQQLSFSSLVSIGLASGLSFTLSHLLHLYQVSLYYGDMKAALLDFTGSAAHRATNAASLREAPLIKYNAKEIGPLTVAKDFLYRVAGRGKYLSLNLMNFIWIILGLRFIKRIELNKKKWVFEFDLRTRDLMALLAAVIISSLWSLVMKQHAHIHGFIARHYYFCYFFCCLIAVTRTHRVKHETI